MILGVGVDTVSIARFNHWASFSDKRLARVFHQKEIEMLKTVDQKVSFLASRFAVKEAAFKAFSSSFVTLKKNMVPFLSFAPLIFVEHVQGGVPLLSIDASWWKELESEGIQIHLSLSHEKLNAIAYVIVDR